MPFLKKSSSAPAPSKEELISSQIENLEQFIEKAPQRVKDEIERQRSSMPAPDDMRERARERDFYQYYSRGQTQNERRYQARNTVLFVLLSTALLATCWWIYAELHRHNILQ